MLLVHRSNRTENLLDALVEVVSKPLIDPLAQETIVVQGRGMERWISMRLASRLGIWANPAFPFPRAFLTQVLNNSLGEGNARRFEPKAMTWTIASLLPAMTDKAGFEPIRDYLLSGDDLQRIQLAAHIADVFDRYILYRPDLINSWEYPKEPSKGDSWQPQLWQALAGREPAEYFGARLLSLIDRLERAEPPLDLSRCPPRVSLFGLSTLAPIYLDAFCALAQQIDVHLFLLTPTREFVADTISPRQKARLQLELALGPDEITIDRGHPLLASLGTLATEFQGLLEEHDYHEGDDDLFFDPAPVPKQASMLQVLQSDLLHRRDRATQAPFVRSELDDSIHLHACHSSMREVEILHDQLLQRLTTDPELEPRDIVVIAPSIDEYTPYIEAVFAADHGRSHIPFMIADRTPQSSDHVVSAFFRILDALGGRLSSSAVFDLLGIEAIRQRFRIDTSEIGRIRNWISMANIRWGIDETHRVAEGQPPISQNTWTFGIERLFLGLALPPDEDRLFAGVLPVNGMGGSEAELLGRFADFCQTLFSFHDLVEKSQTAESWAEDLAKLLSGLVAAEPGNSEQHRNLRSAIERTAEIACTAGYYEPLSLKAFRKPLEREIDDHTRAYGFLSRGVTFCSMVPMRAIPFRVVCLLGMNNSTFPRQNPLPAFDETARTPRRGDRTRRLDDRYLVLEAIMSAREHLIVSWIGRDIQSNSVLPPSVVIADLIESMTDTFTLEGLSGTEIERRHEVAGNLVVQHPLQGFDQRYYDRDSQPELFSFSSAGLRGALAHINSSEHSPLFLAAPLPALDTGVKSVTLDDLEQFLEHSARWFCQRRLGLFTGTDLPRLEERIPIELNKLEQWTIGDQLLRRLLSGEDMETAFAALRGSGRMPPGSLGDRVWEEVSKEAGPIATAARAALGDGAPRSLPVDLEIDGVRLTGTLHQIRSGGIVDCRYSRLGGPHELRLWVRHLVLQQLRAGQTDLPGDTLIFGRPNANGEPGAFRIRPEVNAEAHLGTLIRLWRDSWSVPVPLLPSASRAFAQGIYQHDAPEKALRAAQGAFHSRNGNREWGDFQDAYVARLFGADFLTRPDLETGELPGSRAPALRSFCDTATNVLLPFLALREPFA